MKRGIRVTFFLIRTWRAVRSSLRVVDLASTTKDKDELELGFGVGIVKEEEGNAQEWRNESEEANIVTYCYHFQTQPFSLSYPSAKTRLQFQTCVVLLSIASNFLFGSLKKYSYSFFSFYMLYLDDILLLIDTYFFVYDILFLFWTCFYKIFMVWF